MSSFTLFFAEVNARTINRWDIAYF